MELLNNLLAGAIFLLGVIIVGGNYYRQFKNFKNRNQVDASWSSPTPFIGPIFIIMGYSMLPFVFPSWIFWIIVFDPDTLKTTA